jgi:hypothetical protein
VNAFLVVGIAGAIGAVAGCIGIWQTRGAGGTLIWLLLTGACVLVAWFCLAIAFWDPGPDF